MSFPNDPNIPSPTQQPAEENNKLLQHVLDCIPELIYAKDREGRMIAVNRATLQAIGLDADAVMGKSAREWHPDRGLAAVIEDNDRRIMQTGEPLVEEHTVALPEGVLTYSSITSPLRDESNEIIGVAGSSRNITALKTVEQALRESESGFRGLADAVPQMLWVTQRDGYHEYFNNGWYEFTGVPHGSTDGDGWADLFAMEDRERAQQVWRHSLDTGEPYEIQYRLRHHSGQYRWVLGRAVPIRNDAGAIMKWYGTCTDIHDQMAAAEVLERTVAERTAELANMTKELQRSNRELDQFAYAASHDMQEPLRKIRVFAARLEEKHGALLDADALFHLERISASAERMSTMVDDLLKFSRLSIPAAAAVYEPTDLNDVVRGVLSDFDLAIQQRDARVSVAPLPTVFAVPHQMTQLFYNLISNALKFVRPGEAPRVHIASQQTVTDQEIYEITVVDEGIGFDPQYADRIFEVFNRLNGRSEYAGSGIGLALCKRIVEAHGGKISARSDEGKGAIFTIFLPAARLASVPVGATVDNAERRSGNAS